MSTRFFNRTLLLATLLALVTLVVLACGANEPEPAGTKSEPRVTSAEPMPVPEARPEAQAPPPAPTPAVLYMPSVTQSPPSPASPSLDSIRSPTGTPRTGDVTNSMGSAATSAQSSDQPTGSGPQQPAPRLAPRPNIPRDTATTGPQPLVSASLDPVSTFSLDTDRASFQRGRQAIHQGLHIHPSEVRAEEWINALNYEYPQPGKPDEFAIHTDVFQHPDTPGMHLARVGIQAPEALQRRPVNVTLVMDNSASMGSINRIDIANVAARTILNSLDPRDLVAVVHFESRVKSHYEHMPAQDARRFTPFLTKNIGGGTNVQAGLDKALQLADDARNRNPLAANYVILFSDGVANVNATDPFAILRNVGQDSEYSRVNPIRIVTIGVGITGNDELLEQIAQHGNGWYRYFSTPRDAEITFQPANWGRITNPFADQARAQVTWNPDLVSHWRIVGYENRVTADATFTENRREFAEIPAGTATTVFYELQLTDQVSSRNAATVKLADIEVRWVEPITGVSREQYGAVSGAWRQDFEELDPMLRLGAVTGLSADIYASLDNGGFGTGGLDAGPDRLHTLLQEFDYLRKHIGHVEAYRDLEPMLVQLHNGSFTYYEAYWNQSPPLRDGPGTGYSP